MTGAGVWAIAGRLLAKGLDLVTLVVLARLLTPADFGLVAKAMTIILLVEAVTELTLVEPLVRAPELTGDWYDTSFTLGVLRSVVLVAAVAALGPLLVRYYHEPRLYTLLLVLIAAPVTRSLTSPRMADFIRRYEMRPDFVVNLAGKVASVALVAGLLAVTRTYWAIAAGVVGAPMVMCAVSYGFAPYRPRLSLARWGAFADLVGWTSLAQLFSAVNFQLDRIVVAPIVAVTVFGQFAMANDITSIPFQGIMFPLAGPLTAAFAHAPTAAALRHRWDQALNGILLVVGTVLVALAVLARPLVHAVLGPRWDTAAPYLTWLALAALPMIVAHGLTPLAVATYRARLVTTRTFVELVLKLPCIVVGALWWGVPGAVAGKGLAGIGGALLALHGAAQATGTPVWRQLAGLRRTAAGLAAFAATAWLLRPAVGAGDADTVTGRLALATHIALVAGAAGAVQMTVLLVLWHGAGRPDTGVERRLAALLRRLPRPRRVAGVVE